VSNSSQQPARPWRVVADEMSHTSRGDRILELAEELERAFQEQTPSPSRKAMNRVGLDMADKDLSEPQKNP